MRLHNPFIEYVCPVANESPGAREPVAKLLDAGRVYRVGSRVCQQTQEIWRRCDQPNLQRQVIKRRNAEVIREHFTFDDLFRIDDWEQDA